MEGTGEFLINDIGVETELIYKKDVDLPCFAAFALLKTDEGRDLLASQGGGVTYSGNTCHIPLVLIGSKVRCAINFFGGICSRGISSFWPNFFHHFFQALLPNTCTNQVTIQPKCSPNWLLYLRLSILTWPGSNLRSSIICKQMND